MTKSELISSIFRKKSYLCVGLDPDMSRIPKCLMDHEDPILEFNRAIIEATKDFCVAYKPNLAFYEALGPDGWKTLEKTLELIPEDMFTIADAKRGDIGNTSRLYAKTFFEYFNFDAVTVTPYMGEDSVTPFLDFENKWVIILALTSNLGAVDFQTLVTAEGDAIYQKVLQKSQSWGDDSQVMYVVGATKPEQMALIREMVPNHFLLVPGVGAQGGDLKSISRYGLTTDCGLLINASRSIIYASSESDFAEAAGNEARILQAAMAEILDTHKNEHSPI
jgi:orotidine-5'-phosphate decarboxylase